MKIRLELKPEDLWVGAFWRRTDLRGCSGVIEYSAFDPNTRRHLDVQYDLWVCLLPCLPIHLTWMR